MDSFSDMMTNKNVPNNVTSLAEVDAETTKKLQKAKEMNEQIFKEIHPKEYQQQQQQLMQVELENKQSEAKMKKNLNQLKKEVKKTVHTFIVKSKKMKVGTKKRARLLKKLKSKWKHI